MGTALRSRGQTELDLYGFTDTVLTGQGCFIPLPQKMTVYCVTKREKTGEKFVLLTRLSLYPVWQLPYQFVS